MPIRVNILAGAAAGRTMQLDGPTVTLGRDETCDIAIDLPYVSRVQCELRHDGGQWLLVNHSANGTRLGRRTVTDKPRAIRGGDVLRIGDAAIAEVTPVVEPGPAAAEPAAAPAETASPARRASARLWIGIGVYLLVMLALIIFFATLGERPERADELATLRFLTDEQIEAEVRAPVTKRAPLAERMNENLQQARQFYELREASPDALYRAHQAYRVALSYSTAPGGDALPDPTDQRRYQLAEQQLIDTVTGAYRSAENLMRSRRYDEADRVLASLRAKYPAGRDSAIARSIDELRAFAKRETN